MCMQRYFYLTSLISIVLCLTSANLLAQKDDETISALLANVENAEDSLQKVQYLNELAHELSEINPQKSLKYAQNALSISKKINSQEAQANSLLQIGNAHYHLNQYAKAQTAIDEARKLCESLDYQTGLTDCYNNLAKVNLKTGNRKQAYTYIGKAKEIAEQSDYPLGLAKAYQNLGDWLSEEDQEKAIATYQQALQTFELNGESAASAETLQKIANCYQYQLKDYETAIQYRQQAMRLYENLDDERSLAASFNTIGNTYLEAKKPKLALQHFFQSYVLAREYDFLLNGEHLAQAMNGIGKSYASLARSTPKKDSVKHAEYQRLAQYYLKESEMLSNKNFNVQDFNRDRYRTLMSNANPSPSKNTEAREIGRQKKLLEIENQRLRLEQLARNKQIDRLEALRQKALLRAKEDSLQIQKLDSQLNIMQQTQEQKESQISSLQQENAAKEHKLSAQGQQMWAWIIGLAALIALLLGLVWWRNRQHQRKLSYEQERLKISNERVNRQEVTLRDKEDLIHKKEQRLAATLAELDESRYEQNAMVQILKEEFSPQLGLIIDESQRQEINRLVIHQSGKQMLNLVEQIEQVHQFKNVQMQLYQDKQALQKIADKAFSEHTALAAYKNIQLQNQVPSSQQVYADQEVLVKALDALIYNAIKYSPEGSLIKLEATDKDNFTEIRLQDQGKQVPEDLLDQVFKQYNVEDARPSGMGLAFAKTMVEAHQGEIWLESSKNTNTFCISLPIPAEQTPSTDNEPPKNKVEWLSFEEHKLLQPHIFKIRQREIYETTSIKSTLNNITQDSEGIKRWKSELEDALYALDEQRFKKLINI